MGEAAREGSVKSVLLLGEEMAMVGRGSGGGEAGNAETGNESEGEEGEGVIVAAVVVVVIVIDDATVEAVVLGGGVDVVGVEVGVGVERGRRGRQLL
jgi:hypothetical protein